MSKVLVVDDEVRYREHIGRALARDGHDVRTAGSGREAIAFGSQFRPEVLIADWMLKDHLHGLHVSEALRAVVPDLETILITGFPTSDLRNDARSLQVSEFFEKPFEMARLRDAVRAVTATRPTPLDRSPIAVFEIDRNGVIKYPNERARQLLSGAAGETGSPDLTAMLDFTEFSQVTAATEQWIPICPRWAPEVCWHMRARAHADGQGWIVVVVPDNQKHHKEHPVVQMLLDLPPSGRVRWPIEGRALIVDDDQWVRHVVAEQIEAGGGICHAADTTEAALRTCERDSGIGVVVLDHDLPGENVYDFVRQLRELRPGARIVGTSGSDRSGEFASAGVHDFLLKPWTVTNLINLLMDRLGNCTTCDLPLPLRRPKPGERAQSWICSGCGGRYAAVLDRALPAEMLRNVIPADPPSATPS
jgi:DNA-binding response OmpR family regulator